MIEIIKNPLDFFCFMKLIKDGIKGDIGEAIINKLSILAKKYALINAFKHNGKAVCNAVIGRLVSEVPEIKHKKQILNLTKSIVKQIVDEVNKKSINDIKKELDFLGYTERKHQEKHQERDFQQLLDDIFKGIGIKAQSVITAFPPEPSKYPHIGHAKALLLNYYAAKYYHGLFILRFEDTNPEKLKQEYYQGIIEMLEWLSVKPDKITYASDYLNQLQKLAEKLIIQGDAYVCACKKEDIKASRENSIPCKHRQQTVEQNLSLWNELVKGKHGLILRAKIDLSHKNTAMRDPTLYRVIETGIETGLEHPRIKGIKAWPTYDFQNSMLDALQGITHRFRSKEFELRAELHNYLQKVLGFPTTTLYHFARFQIENTPTSGRVIRNMIIDKKLIGWDDPRLVTIKALKRRGFLPEAITYFLISTGVSKSEAVLKLEALEAVNRKLLDIKANRYFMILNPKPVVIENSHSKVVELKKHPQIDRGFRILETSNRFFIEGEDYIKIINQNQGVHKKVHRLMECLNFVVSEDNNGYKLIFHSDDYKSFKENPGFIIHWLPNDKEQLMEAHVLMPNAKIVKALIEKNIAKETVGNPIQAERIGFLKIEEIDTKNRVVKLIYTHR